MKQQRETEREREKKEKGEAKGASNGEVALPSLTPIPAPAKRTKTDGASDLRRGRYLAIVNSKRSH